MKILNGKELAEFIKERQAREVRAMQKKPTLLILRDSNNPVIKKYVELKKQYGKDIGVNVIDICTDISSRRSGAWQGEDERARPVATGASDALREEIIRANNNSSINGIILQLPIKEKDKTDELTALITPEKDVDGLSGHGNFDSATATAINWLLAGYDIDLEHSKIALVGYGKLVGAPLYRMFKDSGYDVTVFRHGDDLTKLNQYDIIISATGVPGLISSSMIKPDATLVDAGTASEGGVLKGDVSDEIRTRTDLHAITPEKGGVGPLTVTCLFDHVIQASYYLH